MGKIINCKKKTLSDFKEMYARFYYQQKHIEKVEVGDGFPGDINELIKISDKMSKLLSEIKITSIDSKILYDKTKQL